MKREITKVLGLIAIGYGSWTFLVQRLMYGMTWTLSDALSLALVAMGVVLVLEISL